MTNKLVFNFFFSIYVIKRSSILVKYTGKLKKNTSLIEMEEDKYLCIFFFHIWLKYRLLCLISNQNRKKEIVSLSTIIIPTATAPVSWNTQLAVKRGNSVFTLKIR